MKPGTPLPWKLIPGLAGELHNTVHFELIPDGDEGQDSAFWIAKIMGNPSHTFGDQNAAYIVHACNAYPVLAGLVERIVREWDESDMDLPTLVKDCRAAITNLGVQS